MSTKYCNILGLSRLEEQFAETSQRTLLKEADYL